MYILYKINIFSETNQESTSYINTKKNKHGNIIICSKQDIAATIISQCENYKSIAVQTEWTINQNNEQSTSHAPVDNADLEKPIPDDDFVR